MAPAPSTSTTKAAAARVIGCVPMRTRPCRLRSLEGKSFMGLQGLREAKVPANQSAAGMPLAVLAAVVGRRLTAMAIKTVIDAVGPLVQGNHDPVGRRQCPRIIVGGTIIVVEVDDQRVVVIRALAVDADIGIGG